MSGGTRILFGVIFLKCLLLVFWINCLIEDVFKGGTNLIPDRD